MGEIRISFTNVVTIGLISIVSAFIVSRGVKMYREKMGGQNG